MAVLCHFVNLPARDFPPFHKLFLSTPLHSQKFYYHSHHPQRCLRIAASRDGRKAKRDENIGNEIRKFLSSVGLPENHVPSMKELSQNGRQDLANIVRRRGYKYIRQLLEELNTKNMDTGHKGNSEELGGSVGQGENVVILPDDVSSIQEAGYNHGVGTDKGVTINDQSSFAAESTTFSLQEKVAKFIECGELDTIEDCGLQIGHANKAEWNTKSSHSSNDPQGKDISVSVSSGNETLYENGPLSIQRIEHLPFESNSSRNDHLWPKEPTNIDNDLGTEPQKSENQAEIDRLKFLLHQKEMELNELKQQIEKEKLSLSVLQTEAETNMRNAQKLLSEKDSELEEVEGGLSLLQEVEILYSGDGENVEFSGSFNGWHNTITMHLQTPTESSTSKFWRAVLWLYPGVYEIKFIVDGEWRIDPQRESITRGSIQNNILRVDEGLNTPVM